ncbi:MAG: sensor histidine kinase [Thermoplasmatota archaeon]
MDGSRAALAAALESTADGILVVSSGGRILFFNQRFVRMWGIDASVLATRDNERVWDSVLAKVKNSVEFLERTRALYATPDREAFEVIELADGRVFERYSIPLVEDGVSRGRVLSFRDVTARRHTESALEERTRRDAQLLDALSAMGEGVVVLDGGRLVYVNDAYCAITGYTREELLALPSLRALAPAQDLPEAQRRVAERRTGVDAHAHYMARLVAKDGRIVDIEVAAKTLDEQHPTAVLLLVRDVSARHENERALAASETRYRNLFDDIGDPVVVSDTQRRIVDCNAAFTRVYGYTLDEVRGRDIGILYASSDEYARVGAEYTRNAASEPIKARWLTRSLQRRKDGTTFLAESAASVVRDHAGRIIGRMGVLRDVTEQERVEDARRLAAQRMRELAELKDVNAFKTQLLSTASHELNTPITPLKLQLHLLKSASYGELNEKQRKAVDVLDRNLERLSLLVRDVLDVARLQSGKMKIAPQPLDCAAVIRDVAESFEPQARAAGVTLETRFGAGDMTSSADLARITQVVFNLASNALKFTPRGGRITLETRLARDEVVVSVSDSGIGLVPAQIARLFQPFTQVHDGAASAPSGTGLGLYICRGIVEQHGGRIWCESEGPGRGSLFAFSLPVARRAAPVGRAAPVTRREPRP